MKVLVTGRQSGKTAKLIKWVQEGEKTYSYPYWTRVIVTMTMAEADRLRGMGIEYNQVYYLSEWRKAHLGPLPIEVAIDNLDLMISYLLDGRGIPSVVTMTGEVWNA